MQKRTSLFLDGALAGGVATLCMSLVMIGSKKLGVQGEHPPKRIAEAVLASTGDSQQPQPKVEALSVAAHFGFGMVAGGVFALLERRLSLKRPILSGVAYGLLVWAVSYKGWIPALNILPPPERDRPGRPTTMIAAHVVYGAVLAKCLHGKYRSEMALR
jgi:uncharacterized membrane protein YagU involved in acid resistance